MKSITTDRFWKAYQGLSAEVKLQARNAYRLWKTDPSHPSLHFKKVHDTKPIYSVRINLNYRTLGMKKDDTMIWFWIGSHAEYDRLLDQL